MYEGRITMYESQLQKNYNKRNSSRLIEQHKKTS